jgi:Lectin C-type domain
MELLALRTAQNVLLTVLSSLTACQTQLAEIDGSGLTGTSSAARPSASAAGDSGPSTSVSTGGTGTAAGSEGDASTAPSQSGTTAGGDGGAPSGPLDAGGEAPDAEAGLAPEAGDAAFEPDSAAVGTSPSTSGSAGTSAEPSMSVAPTVSAPPSASASAPPPGPCPMGATYFASDDACYRVTPTQETRADAATTCATFGTGWHLAEVRSAEQNTNIRSLNTGSELWLGAARASGGTTWRWLFSGIDFFEGTDALGSPIGDNYVNWNSLSQPSGGELELCARMLIDGTWGDVDCLGSGTLPYGACQGPPSN